MELSFHCEYLVLIMLHAVSLMSQQILDPAPHHSWRNRAFLCLGGEHLLALH